MKSRWRSATWPSSRCALATGCGWNGRSTRRQTQRGAAPAVAAAGGKRRQARGGAQRRGADIKITPSGAAPPVVIKVTNTVPAGQGEPGHGVALDNVRDRLRLLHDVQAASSHPGGWRVPGAHRGAGMTPPVPTGALTALIVDDEPLARARLRTLLGDCTPPVCSVEGEAANATQAMAYLLRRRSSMWRCWTSTCPAPTA